MFLKKVRNIFCFSEAKNVSDKCYLSAQTRKHLGKQQCFRNNVSSFAGANNNVSATMFPRLLKKQETFVRNIFCFRETKNVFDFFQKHFFFSTNVSPFARRGNNVSATVFPQQCFLVCGGLKTLRPDYSPPCMF